MSKLITLKEVAEHFSVTTRTVRNWLKEPNNPFEKIGAKWYVKDITKLEEWLKNK